MITAFKEWKSVCDALERGDQTIILRKGGIAEGKQGFLWQHREFFLFPTAYHNHRDQLKVDHPVDQAAFAKRDDGQIEIRLCARIIWSADIDKLDSAKAFSPFHIWNDEVIEQRFDYTENKGIRLALLKVFRLKEPLILQDQASFGGCRSWLELPASENLKMNAVLSDSDFQDQQNQLENLLNKTGIEITKFDQ
ncbi:MAG: DUF1802 family protein [Verrucomicrobiota bacterium]